VKAPVYAGAFFFASRVRGKAYDDFNEILEKGLGVLQEMIEQRRIDD